MAILDAARCRRPVTRAAALAAVLIAAVVAIPIACVRVAAVENQKSVVESKASAPVPATLPVDGKMVFIEARFLDVPAKDRKSVDEIFAKSGVARPEDAHHASIVTEDQAAALLKEIRGLPGASLLSAPRLLAYEGREARISVASRIPVTLPLVENRARFTTAMLDTGVFLEVVPETAKGSRDTNLKIASRVIELLPNRKNVARESRTEVDLTVPEGKWVLLHAPAKTYLLTGIISTKTDPQTNRPETEFERQAVDEASKDAKDVYILVKPQLVTDAEAAGTPILVKPAPGEKLTFDVRGGHVHVQRGADELEADEIAVEIGGGKALFDVQNGRVRMRRDGASLDATEITIDPGANKVEAVEPRTLKPAAP